ncbi:MAG: hypothetical protein RIQ93_1292 [Verrucomicrobiota bacterium]|jgi:hypothetical protein
MITAPLLRRPPCSGGLCQWLAGFALLLFVDALVAAEAPNWTKVTENAAWKARDSSGETVFKDQLWLLGGWYDSFHEPPRDVWSSADGKAWKLITEEAPWRHSDLPMTTASPDRLWMMGGWHNGRLPDASASNQVWSSVNGAQWDLVTPHAGWSPRIAAGCDYFDGKIWIVGGIEKYYFGDEKSLKNDVWSSRDGITWQSLTDNAPWSPRAYHQVVAFRGRLWLLGGGNYLPGYKAFNDVWSSADGREWVRVTASAPWHPRMWFSALVYRDRLWVLGGWSNEPSQNWNDVWYTEDGAHWEQLKTEVTWSPRHEHSGYVLADKIFIAGGNARPLQNDVWSLALPSDWGKARTPKR